ncbi:MAG TPA: hypothetical protein VEK56_16780 [Vicinamibacterales bacterium]|nr:hypothetical protein [Vicinamibacterales bacterium]
MQVRKAMELTGPQPARRRPPKRELCGLAAGDVLALALPRGVALLRVVRVYAYRLGEYVVIEELDFDGPEVPARDALERLGSRVNDPVTFVDRSAPDMRFFALVSQRIDWQHAGFQKVQTIGGSPRRRAGGLPNCGISWAVLAERLRRRAAQ